MANTAILQIIERNHWHAQAGLTKAKGRNNLVECSGRTGESSELPSDVSVHFVTAYVLRGRLWCCCEPLYSQHQTFIVLFADAFVCSWFSSLSRCCQMSVLAGDEQLALL